MSNFSPFMFTINYNYLYFTVYDWLVGVFTFSDLGLLVSKILWGVLGAGLLIFIITIYRKHQELDRIERGVLNEAVRERSGQVDAPNREWQKITDYLSSSNPSDWKLAILEADTLLDILVKKMGYDGENLGERLKKVEPSDFLTLNAAWEAHKVRNAIAHEAGYELSEREAKRVIKLFESVFEEFEYI